MANLACSTKRCLWYLPTQYTLPSMPLFGGFLLKLKRVIFFFKWKVQYSSYVMIFACDIVSQICDNLPTLQLFIWTVFPLLINLWVTLFQHLIKGEQNADKTST